MDKYSKKINFLISTSKLIDNKQEKIFLEKKECKFTRQISIYINEYLIEIGSIGPIIYGIGGYGKNKIINNYYLFNECECLNYKESLKKLIDILIIEEKLNKPIVKQINKL